MKPKKLKIIKSKLRPLTPDKKYFQSLVRSIIYQQLSGKAAASIFAKFKALFGKVFPKPAAVLEMSDEKLRSAGLSRGKIVYIKDLAAKFLDGTINTRKLGKWSDEEIIGHLTKVKGIGVWTVHMFLIFTLGRPNVLPTGDLAIRKGFQKAFSLDHLPTHDEMTALAAGHNGEWTTLTLHLWHIMDEGIGEW